MGLTKRQFIFAKYLLNKIGYQDANHITKYLDKLEEIYGYYYSESVTEHRNGRSYTYLTTKYSASDCIDQLLIEVNLKKSLASIEVIYKNLPKNLSATDLSSYKFCPASYCINKSFKISYPSNQIKTDTGIKFHETLRLINKQSFKTSNEYITSNVKENQLINKIKKCDVIFIGHSGENEIFINKEKNYIGQPDYIFKDPNGKYFVVEEKFQYLYRNKEKSNSFFENHLVQLQSYVDYIQNYNIEYGILIYWFYDIDKNIIATVDSNLNHSSTPYVHDVSLKIIQKNEYDSLLTKCYNDLTEFTNKKQIDFPADINQNKCGACTVNKYCAHKTGKYNTLSIPYNRYLLKLEDIQYPNNL